MSTTTRAKDLLASGRLADAIEALNYDVKAQPGDIHLRTFLFELLCFAGDWDRAEKQLDVIADTSAQAEIAALVYRSNLKAERERQRVFFDRGLPYFFSEPPGYVDLQIDALHRLTDGKSGEITETLDSARALWPVLSGDIDGTRFESFRDTDDLLGPVLELIVRDKYTWLPLEQVASLEIDAPRQLRDLMWAPARIESRNGTKGNVFIPALYAGSMAYPNEHVKLGRMTDWKEIGSGYYTAVGARQFDIADEEKAMLQMRKIVFESKAGRESKHGSGGNKTVHT